MRYLPTASDSAADARVSRADANKKFRAEAELQAGLHHIGAGLTVDALAASFSNDNDAGPVTFAIIMPRMLPLPPFASMTLAQRMSIIHDVARTLASMHALPGEHVLHRDTKPANLLLDKPLKDGGRAHLCDFGESVSRAGVTMPAGFFGSADHTLRGPRGTLGYMDPALLFGAVHNRVRAIMHVLLLLIPSPISFAQCVL